MGQSLLQNGLVQRGKVITIKQKRHRTQKGREDFTIEQVRTILNAVVDNNLVYARKQYQKWGPVTNALHESGLVVKTRHGGNGFRSSYQPNWDKLRDIVEAFSKDDGTAEIVNKRAPTKCTNVHLDSEQTFTLTNIRNLPKELTDTDGASGRVGDYPSSKPVRTVSEDRVQGLLRESLRHRSVHKRQLPSVVLAQEAASDLAPLN